MSLTRNIVSTFSSRVAMMGLALASSVVLARWLGPEGRGIFALVLILPELAASFGLFGFDQANTVYSGLEPGGRRALVWHSVVIAAIAGGALVLGGATYLALGAPGFRSLIHGPLWLYLVPLSAVPLRLLTEYWGSILRGMNLIGLINAYEVGTKVVSLSLLIALVIGLRFGVAGAIWADWVIGIGGAFLLLALLQRVGLWGKPSLDAALWRRSGKFAFPAYCASILSFLNYRVDQIILALMVPPEQLAFYVVAVGLAERMWLPTGAVAMALLPHLTTTPDRDPALPATIARHVIIWTGAACVGVFVLADFIVRILYSSTYAPAAVALRWLLPGIFMLSLGKVLIAELLAREKIGVTFWMGTVVVITNFGGNLMLIPRMGIAGASLASSISYTLLSILVCWYYLRLTGVRWTKLVPRWADVQAYYALARRHVPAAVARVAGD